VELPLLNVVSGQKPRQIAARILQQRRAGADFVEDLLEKALAGLRISPADRGLCQELVYGIVRWQATLDWLIARKTAGRAQRPMLRDVLQLGLYQIFWLDRIPAHAAVHETVELAKQNGLGAQAGLVNAILRGYLRESDVTRKLLGELKRTQPALGYSHPEWLVARWQARWGEAKTARLLEWNNTPPDIYARVNTLKVDPGRLLARWREEDVEYDFFLRDWLDENLVFRLKSHPPLAKLPSQQQGLFYVQDPGTLLAVRELAPQAGETVLDLCAAPGGKTTFIGQRMRNEGRVVACDTTRERLKRVEENCRRLGVTCVEPLPLAGTSDLALRTGHFDKVLVDVPCSNTGVMRRRVDLRWRIRPAEIERLRRAQLKLLNQAAPLVRPGGILVYSTCSLEPEENHELVGQFLREHEGFKLEGERDLLPFVDGVDGAYVARLARG